VLKNITINNQTGTELFNAFVLIGILKSTVLRDPRQGLVKKPHWSTELFGEVIEYKAKTH
jgi:hypothetical protein